MNRTLRNLRRSVEYEVGHMSYIVRNGLRDLELLLTKFAHNVARFGIIEIVLGVVAFALFGVDTILDPDKPLVQRTVGRAISICVVLIASLVFLQYVRGDPILAGLFQRLQREQKAIQIGVAGFVGCCLAVVVGMGVSGNITQMRIMARFLAVLILCSLTISAEMYQLGRERANGGNDNEAEYRRRMLQLQGMDLSAATYEFLRSLDDFISTEHRATPPEVLKGLPTFAAEDDEEACSICLGEIKKGEKLKVLPCFHRGHNECLEEWLKQSKECPICGTPTDASMDFTDDI